MKTPTLTGENNVWSGPRREYSYPPTSSLGAEILKCLKETPDFIFQICCSSGKEYTNRDIATLSVRIATHLRDHLCTQQGDVIGICSSNTDYMGCTGYPQPLKQTSTDYITPLVIGGLLAGVTLNLLDTTYDWCNMKHLYSTIRPSKIFCDGKVYQRVKEISQELQLNAAIYTLDNHIEGIPQITEFLEETGLEDSFEAEPLKDGLDQIAVIGNSSGTTGIPKGICLSHAAFLNLELFFDASRLLYFGPLHWISIPYNIAICTKGNFTRILSDKCFSSQEVFDIVEKYNVDVIYSASAHLALLAGDLQLKHRDLSSVKEYMYGGGAVSASLIEKLKPSMPDTSFRVIYGLTETTGTCGFAWNGDGLRLVESMEMCIVDDNGNRLGPNERGEVLIRTPYRWAGYCGKPELTEKVFRNGWFHTDDIGYFDDDGKLHIVDRKKEMLKFNNYYFGPSEIEDIIYSLKDVREVCVYAVPDAVATSLPAAAIIKADCSPLTERDVIEHVARNAPWFMHLRGGACFLDALPKTSTAKMIRNKIAYICEQMNIS